MTKYNKDRLDVEYVERVLSGSTAAIEWSADPVSVLADGSRVVCLKLPRQDATPTIAVEGVTP